jgi:hypothetical protein
LPPTRKTQPARTQTKHPLHDPSRDSAKEPGRSHRAQLNAQSKPAPGQAHTPSSNSELKSQP